MTYQQQFTSVGQGQYQCHQDLLPTPCAGKPPYTFVFGCQDWGSGGWWSVARGGIRDGICIRSGSWRVEIVQKRLNSEEMCYLWAYRPNPPQKITETVSYLKKLKNFVPKARQYGHNTRPLSAGVQRRTTSGYV